MKRILTAIVAILVMGSSAFAQNVQSNEKATVKETRTEIATYLASLPKVSVTYLTKSMLQRLPKGKTESPLRVLADKGGINSIRVFELGNAEAEAAGKRLLNAYVSESSTTELLLLQNDTSNEVLIYGIPFRNDVSNYRTVLMYSKMNGKRAILIIISGMIHDSTIGELIDSFSE